MNSTKAYEYETLQRAKDVVSKITKPSMSKSEKFETCFRLGNVSALLRYQKNIL